MAIKARIATRSTPNCLEDSMRRLTTLFVLTAGAMATVIAADRSLTMVLKWNPNAKLSAPALDTTRGILPVSFSSVADKRNRGELGPPHGLRGRSKPQGALERDRGGNQR